MSEVLRRVFANKSKYLQQTWFFEKWMLHTFMFLKVGRKEERDKIDVFRGLWKKAKETNLMKYTMEQYRI